MKFYSLILLFFIQTFAFSQDGIAPLTTNPELFHKETNRAKALENSFDSTFVYITDTVSLPFFDEFSRDRFQKYDAEFSDPNVTEQLFYSMLDETSSLPLAPDTEYSDVKTYRSEYDAFSDTTYIYFYDSIRFLYDDLSAYPPNHTLTFGYPPFIVFDTLDGTGNLPDTIWTAEPAFTQDSARIFLVEINDPDNLWLNETAYHNYRFAVEPWSLGVVSFDGLDAFGKPYSSNQNAIGTADTLFSKPIDMSTASIGDSVYFSFLFQREGFGDIPESDDSLFVDFYSPISGEWTRVWRTNGGALTDFKVAHIPVTDPDYFQKGFKFRMMNYGNQAGGIDHFHVDYVHLRRLSGYQDTLFKDFAFVYPISTLLKDYTSVPWKHYRNNPAGKMNDAVKIVVRNGSELTENNQNGNVSVYYDGNLEGSFVLNASTLSGGNINYAPRTTYTSFHDFSTGYSFDASLPNDTSAVFDWVGNASAQFPSYPLNDSTFGTQVFENYYAYDDGTAEKAYGVTGEQALLAYQFNAYQPDSLVAIQMHFVHSVVDVSNNLFLLSVWDDAGGEPGNLLYEDEFFLPRQPKYTSARNKFTYYYFKDTAKVAVGSTFYIGMRQIDEERLNIGMDMNHDFSDRIFWSVNGGAVWNNASFPGALMMRPVVTSKMDYLLGLENHTVKREETDFTIYPNPTSSQFRVRTSRELQGEIQVYDLNGRLIKTENIQQPVDVSNFEPGIYLVSVYAEGKLLKTKKLVVQ
ncbi:MAG: T9SS type A sorting domain-containing protein [Brumimicrobium sp.]|nr:T9SS type A sorting domain-containing protein [Brumimicrobium sp.]